MKVAVAGCCHGHLDATYKQINDLENRNNYKVDLLLINGDFQAIRNHQDLLCMSVPDKYKKLGAFYKYYTGEEKASVLTIVIGGNHEASNYMWELYHGGWLAPNIYYTGGSGCVKVGDLRIAGASGIYHEKDYRLGHHERMPYDKSNLRSAYHVRFYDVMKLRQLSSPDVFMSHDWPVDITRYGDVAGLLKRKPFFKSDIEKGELGSPPMMDLLRSLRPSYWFSAHLHCKFEALVNHEPEAGESSVPSLGQTSAVPAEAEMDLSGGTVGTANPDEIQLDDLDDTLESYPPLAANPSQSMESGPKSNPDEILIEDDEGSMNAAQVSSESTTQVNSSDNVRPGKAEGIQRMARGTRFLALDKCLPGRQYLHVLDIDPATPGSDRRTSPPTLTYDREWLAISRALHPFLSTERHQTALPPVWDLAPLIQESQRWVDENIGEREIRLVQEFTMTAPGPVNTDPRPARNLRPPPWYTNPQTEAFCAMLGLENKVNPPPV
ncbi:Lariat debranching enzyme OS=Schizosaccharomyces pombe (strain 972 / ATCC 24843) GN=dbr1 PE=3 SV=2 [Rhizoctonia solani AG-1 IB]|uniref:Lariat debranching enzyme n=1 Tax=Thanatephorus cucumeris (strain AG1-IB / isolate 7/3/14) TaxID=1108050 RepID=A0A0B7FY41_THACB|nr:Lariat debranching enzyme OS=Schizosaccharomyces pombe (strain 972 / ATCC 24843) GN=dbr1 PE=3 SV=2 [Rhizoctonia solani AG-1 IB]